MSVCVRVCVCVYVCVRARVCDVRGSHHNIIKILISV